LDISTHEHQSVILTRTYLHDSYSLLASLLINIGCHSLQDEGYRVDINNPAQVSGEHCDTVEGNMRYSFYIYTASFLVKEIGKIVLAKDNRDTRPSYAKSWTYLSWFDIEDMVSFKTFP
jgi:hypothetical protein